MNLCFAWRDGNAVGRANLPRFRWLIFRTIEIEWRLPIFNAFRVRVIEAVT